MSTQTSSPQLYFDESGKQIIPERKLEEGGEGIVYTVFNNPNIVLKIYKSDVLQKHDKSEKIKAMCDLYDPDLAKFSALPQKVVYNSSKEVVGFIMQRAHGEKIHKLYGISDKIKFFPNADWGFMVRAAANLARAVDSLHSKDIVLGDVNQGNYYVDNRAMIKLIDCDSYQIEHMGKTYYCEVGVPEYTPPELQGISFSGVRRTKNHDCFGLAVMIFKILMFAKHPYSGIGAPPEIGEAIQQGYYCFSSNTKQPSPSSAQWYYYQIFSTLSDEIKDLFEQAFSANNAIRPTAAKWVIALDNFEKELVKCQQGHKYNNANLCVWCRLAQRGFIPFPKIVNKTSSNNKTTTPKKGQTPLRKTPTNPPPTPTPKPAPKSAPKPAPAPSPAPSYSPPQTQKYQTSSSNSSNDNGFSKWAIAAVVIIILGVIGNIGENSSNNTYNEQPKTYTESPSNNNTNTQTTNYQKPKAQTPAQTSAKKPLASKNKLETNTKNPTTKTKNTTSTTPKAPVKVETKKPAPKPQTQKPQVQKPQVQKSGAPEVKPAKKEDLQKSMEYFFE